MVYLIDNSTYSKVLLVYSTPIKNYLLQLFLKEFYKLLFKSFFWLFRFHSPLLPESRLISFPIGTVMFYFPTFYNFWFTLGLYKF